MFQGAYFKEHFSSEQFQAKKLFWGSELIASPQNKEWFWCGCFMMFQPPAWSAKNYRWLPIEKKGNPVDSLVTW